MEREFVSLYTDGESSHSIAKKFYIDHKTILKHLHTAGAAVRSKSESIKIGLIKGRVKSVAKPHILSPDSKNLTREKAYVLGVLAGDGWLSYYPEKRICQIGLEAVDEEFIDEFRRCLNKVYGLNPSKKKVNVKNPRWKDKHRVRLCCKAACEDLLSYGVSFKQNNWLIPPAIKSGSIGARTSYLRGFFDSEGSVENKCRRIKGTSSHLRGLEDISALLWGLGIRSRIAPQSKENAYDVRIQDRASVELFTKHVGFIIMRKADRLQRMLASYKLWMTLPSETMKLEPKMRHLRALGLAYEEIAKRLGLGIGTVWKHLNKNDTSEGKDFICSSNRNTRL